MMPEDHPQKKSPRTPRVLLGSLGVLVCCLLSWLYLFGSPFRPQRVDEDAALAALMPSPPFLYVQGSQIHHFLKKVEQSPQFQTFLQSPWWQQVSASQAWQDFTVSFQEAVDDMVIDPMRVAGDELAIGVYETRQDEVFPGVLVISKIDWLAQASERLLYLFDRVSGEVGISFQQEIEDVPVYVVKRYDLLIPVYYSVIEQVAFLSTSLPLLQETLNHVLHTSTRHSLLPERIGDIPDSRFLTCAIDPARMVTELYRNRLAGRSARVLAENMPLTEIGLEVEQESIRLNTMFFSENTRPRVDAEKISTQGERKNTFPLLLRVEIQDVDSVLKTLKKLFPLLDTSVLAPWKQALHQIFGHAIECRLSPQMLGTLYALPDLFCRSKVAQPERAYRFLDQRIDSLIQQSLPGSAQRALMKKVNEPYQQSIITTWRMMLQDLVSYAVFPSQLEESAAYVLAGTNSAALKETIAPLRASPEQGIPSFFSQEAVSPNNSGGAPVASVLVDNVRMSEWLSTFSKTPTFMLLFPPQQYPELHQTFPALLLLLQSLPPVWGYAQVQEETFSLSLEIFQ